MDQYFRFMIGHSLGRIKFRMMKFTPHYIFSQKQYLIKWAWQIFHRGFLIPNFTSLFME